MSASIQDMPVNTDQASVAEQAEQTIRSRGHGALLPFQLGTDKRRFVAPDGGVVVSGTYGRFEVALGDPIGVDDAAPSMAAFIATCRARHQIPGVYQASDGSVSALVALGLRTFRVGHEAVVPLADFTLKTPRRANLRHTVTRARRGGVTFTFSHGLDAAERARLLPGLVEIDAQWQATAGPPLRFTIGHFDPADVDKVAIAVALEADGQPAAFATFRPAGQGAWVLDLMRRRVGGTPGALEGCLVEAAMAFASAGATDLSLGLAPLARLSGDATVREERALVFGARAVRRWYDVDGLAFFKSKFDPVWVPRYAAVPSRMNLIGYAIALLGLHLGGYRPAGRQAIRRFSFTAAGRLRATKATAVGFVR